MKAEEAILKLTTRPDLDQQVLDSPFFKFYRRIDMETCNEIAALIEAQAKVVDAAKYFAAGSNMTLRKALAELEGEK
jgi:hypothetical protein